MKKNQGERMRNFAINLERILKLYLDISQKTTRSQYSSILIIVLLFKDHLPEKNFHNEIRHLANQQAQSASLEPLLSIKENKITDSIDNIRSYKQTDDVLSA